MHIILIITVYLSFHYFFKEFIELSLTEPDRYLNRAIFVHFKLIAQHYLPSYSDNCGHMCHPWYLNIVCFQVFDELFNGESVSLNIHVLLILGFSPDSGRGEHSAQVFPGLIIVDSLGDDFLRELSRLV